MPRRPNPPYVSHIIFSHDVAEIAMSENVNMVLDSHTGEYREKIKLIVFEDLLRRFEGDTWIEVD